MPFQLSNFYNSVSSMFASCPRGLGSNKGPTNLTFMGGESFVLKQDFFQSSKAFKRISAIMRMVFSGKMVFSGIFFENSLFRWGGGGGGSLFLALF